MSKLIKKPIILPANTKIEIKGEEITVIGPKGSVTKKFLTEFVDINTNENKIFVVPKFEKHSKRTGRFIKKLAGTYWSILNSMVLGVNQGYTKTLQIVGLGWKANQKGESVELSVGYSHPVVFTPPKGVSVKVEDPQRITVSGVDKELVGQVAANIRKIRKPDSYKGKGIRYADENLVLKESKKGAKGR
ncbi:MAG: 50S ribosomal protein L6 [Candidatus Calescibacterium sp.]|nr:50S ribosomal protein L6 [Candidatus Calescibacterium sp.]MCX7972715.1 50S ribosomal protein L6 [bacterium]MDW8195519.1 50S ribosomal protein L6 [Candidatus Calescibacterium sp.]